MLLLHESENACLLEPFYKLLLKNTPTPYLGDVNLLVVDMCFLRNLL